MNEAIDIIDKRLEDLNVHRQRIETERVRCEKAIAEIDAAIPELEDARAKLAYTGPPFDKPSDKGNGSDG